MLEITKQRLRSAKSRVDKFIDQNILDWGTQEVLEPIRLSMIQAGLSQNAANALRIVKTGFMKISVVWDYRGKNDEPLHFYIEYDTKPHRILPRFKDRLSWVDKSGKRVWAREVNHPGTTGKMIVHSGVEERKPFLRARVIKETNDYAQVTKL